MYEKSLFLILLVFSAIISNAQTSVLRGTVIDEQKQLIPGANILIKGTNTGAISNLKGEYYINKLKPGTYTLEVSYIGFKNLSVEVTLVEGKTCVQNIELQPGLELSEVVVNSRLVGEAKALNNQKNALNITNMISFEQLERFPDANIGDALKRLSGINVQNDQGEARFGNVRGTSPELNTITINGERIPSAEGEIRVVQLDLVSSDMIQAVEFNKAITPDMDADAIGGAINLVTKSAPYKQEIKGSIGSGWNFVSNKPSVKGSLTYGKRFFNDKLGVVASASIYNNLFGSDNIEAVWDYTDENKKDASAYTSEFQNRQYYIQRLRQSYSLSLDYKFNEKHSLFFSGIYNWRNDWENRYRTTFKDLTKNADGSYKTELRRQLKFGTEDNKFARLEDQKMMTFNLGGQHNFGTLKVDWAGAYSVANEERPNERYLQYRIKGVNVNLNLDDMEKPMVSFLANPADYNTMSSKYSFHELTEEYQFTEEVDKNFKLNFELPIAEGKWANKLKFGARYRGKSKMRNNWLNVYTPLDKTAFTNLALQHLKDISKDNFMAGDYSLGKFIDPEISKYIDLNDATKFKKEEDLTANGGDFDATENIYAGYAMLTQNLGEKITLLAGVRYENTRLEYQGRVMEIGEDVSITKTNKIKDDYINILPAIHLKYEISKSSNVRLAWTNTLSRPNYYDLVPYQEINRDDEEIFFGNPELKPLKSMNFDLMYESFFKNIGQFSAGIFAKKIRDVIAWQYKSDYVFNGTTYKSYRKPENIGDADLLGFEAGFSRRLDFLPSFMKNFSIYGNYTYVQSELKNIIFEGRENDKLPLAGSPKHNFNISLAYDSKKFDIRLSFNHASAFLNVNEDGGFGEEAFYDFYYDATNNLDLNLNFKLNKRLQVYADATNLLNQPLRTYWGKSERTAQAEYYGIKLNAGIKFQF
jgi:TonB-dependent receptor